MLGEGAQKTQQMVQMKPAMGSVKVLKKLPHADIARWVGVLLEQLRIRMERENDFSVCLMHAMCRLWPGGGGRDSDRRRCRWTWSKKAGNCGTP